MENHRQPSLDEELLKLIANQVLYSPYNMVLAMSIVSYIMFRHIPDKPLIWGGWMLLVIASQIYRNSRLKKLPFEHETPVEKRTGEAAKINFACVFILSLSLLAFPIWSESKARPVVTLRVQLHLAVAWFVQAVIF